MSQIESARGCDYLQAKMQKKELRIFGDNSNNHHMAVIEVGHGLRALVDDSDHDRLRSYSWRAFRDRKSGNWYAYRNTPRSGGEISRRVYLHNEVMGVIPGNGLEVDHIDPNETLDNRRSNLRVSTRSQNNCNRRKRSDNKSGYKGVSWSSSGRGWVAQIMKDRRQYNLGTFATPEQAHAAYCEAAKRLHGEFARTA